MTNMKHTSVYKNFFMASYLRSYIVWRSTSSMKQAIILQDQHSISDVTEIKFSCFSKRNSEWLLVQIKNTISAETKTYKKKKDFFLFFFCSTW